MENLWVNMSVIQDIVNGAARYGADATAICKAAAIDPTELILQDKKVDYLHGHKVWQEAVRQTNNPLLGLHLGAATTTSIIGLIGHLMQASKTLGEAFQHVANYSSVVTNMFSYETELTPRYFILHLNPCDYWAKQHPETALQASDQAVAGVINVCKLLTGKKISPDFVELNHNSVKPDVYNRILKSPVSFGAKSNKVVFDAGVAQLPILGYNEALETLFLKLLNESKSSINPTFKEKISEIISRQYYSSLPLLDEVAELLNISPRTLQRRLNDESTSFQQLSDKFKKAQALDLLSLNTHSISEIAYMLGYAEPATFRRAFKRWTGKTPKETKYSL